MVIWYRTIYDELNHTKRQLERCKQRMMKVLQERRLCLSSKKTRIGSINNAFHLLAALPLRGKHRKRTFFEVKSRTICLC